METPPSRRSQSSSSSAAPAETLPPVMLPSSLAEERRTELEAETHLSVPSHICTTGTATRRAGMQAALGAGCSGRGPSLTLSRPRALAPSACALFSGSLSVLPSLPPSLTDSVAQYTRPRFPYSPLLFLRECLREGSFIQFRQFYTTQLIRSAPKRFRPP